VDLASILLGAALSAGGGFFATRYSARLKQAREEQALLFEAQKAISSICSQLQTLEDPEHGVQNEVYAESELVKLYEQLSGIALRLALEEHRTVAVRMSKVAFDKPFQKFVHADELHHQVHALINGPMIAAYESEIENEPGKF
jgi:hypothetical protein